MRPGWSAGPRRRRGATREGDRPAWQGGSEASNRKPGTPVSRAKPLPRSAGVRSRVLVVRCFHLPAEREGTEQGARRNQEASVMLLCGSKGDARRRRCVTPAWGHGRYSEGRPRHPVPTASGRWRMDRNPYAGLPPPGGRSRDRLRPAIVRHAAWKAAISAAADWRETVAAGAVGAS